MRLHAVDTHRDIPQRVGAHKSGRVESQEESSQSGFSQRCNAELQSDQQNYGDDPLADRAKDLYRREFVMGFADRWDELIDWDARRSPKGSSSSTSSAPEERRAFSMPPREPAFIPSA